MNDRKPEGTELKAAVARALGPDCIGCVKHEAAVMLSFIPSDGFVAGIRDVFLDRETALALHEELGRRLFNQ